MKYLSRREFLRGVGTVAIGLPLLESMACRAAGEIAPGTRPDAATPAATPDLAVAEAPLATGPLRPKRFVGILVPNGTLPDLWFPTGGETDFKLNTLMQSYAPHKDDLLIFKGVDMVAATRGPTDGHREGVAAWLTGYGLTGNKTTDATSGGVSIDQAIAARIGRTTKIGSLQIGFEGNAGNIVQVAQSGAGQPLPNDGSPRSLFSRLFGDVLKDPSVAARERQRRHSVLDGVKADYRALAPRISSADRRLVDEHLASIRDVERRLDVNVSCALPPGQLNADVDFQFWPDAIMDLITLAFRCDLTRVVTLVYRHPGGGGSYFPWLGLGTDYWRCLPAMPNCNPMDANAPRRSDEHHEMSHSPITYRDELTKIHDWHYSKMAGLITRLKAASDGAGSLFDSSLLFQGSDIATGPHTKEDMPFLLAGSAGGYFKTGRYLTYTKAPHNNLLVSILNAMDIPTGTFGAPDLCTGPLPNLT